jgi:hypothetical protein
MEHDLLLKFIKFWDNWHFEWFSFINNDEKRQLNRSLTDNISSNSRGKKINESLEEHISLTMVQNIPLIREKFNLDSTEIYSAEIIPEPYWGAIDVNKNLHAIFMNINPFLGNGASSKLFYEVYKSGYKSYTNHLKENQTITNPTTRWLKQKRGLWFYNLHNVDIPKLKGNKTDYEKLNIDQILSCDIVPWHTPKKNDLSRYLKQPKVIDFIAEYQIDHIAELALFAIRKDSYLFNKVIVRSSVFIDYINSYKLIRDKFDEKIEYYVIQNNQNIAKKFSSYLTIVTHKIHRTRFYIFSDGVSMELPDVNYLVHKLNQDKWEKCTLRDFIKNDIHTPSFFLDNIV